MNIYNKIKPYLISTCVSFSIVIFIQPLLFLLDGDKNMAISIVYQIFIVCCFVNIAIALTDQLPITKVYLRILISIVDVVGVVLSMNIFVFKGTAEYTIENISLTIIFLIFTYFCVYALVCVKNKSDEKSINTIIKERRQGN